MARKIFTTTTLIGVAMLIGACSPAWGLPSTAQQPAINLPATSVIPTQPNSPQQTAPQNGSEYATPQAMPNAGMNQQGNEMNQSAPQPQNNYGNMSNGMWGQQNNQNQAGAYGYGSRMRGGMNGYDNCAGGYGYNNGYALVKLFCF
ncbi:MAG: hypothetical protein J7K85_05660 [Anaerolineaceae bacterium]|nr:hypothetical protein [Anaerolineaceae bacterium]